LNCKRAIRLLRTRKYEIIQVVDVSALQGTGALTLLRLPISRERDAANDHKTRCPLRHHSACHAIKRRKRGTRKGAAGCVLHKL